MALATGRHPLMAQSGSKNIERMGEKFKEDDFAQEVDEGRKKDFKW